jgi:hypothetical protein
MPLFSSKKPVITVREQSTSTVHGRELLRELLYRDIMKLKGTGNFVCGQ